MKPTQAEIDAWDVAPKLKPWEEAYGLLDVALRQHPALKGKHPDEHPRLWASPDSVELYPPGRDETASYVIDSPSWYIPITNRLAARRLADEMVNGLRERMREARRAGRSPGPGSVER